MRSPQWFRLKVPRVCKKRGKKEKEKKTIYWIKFFIFAESNRITLRNIVYQGKCFYSFKLPNVISTTGYLVAVLYCSIRPTAKYTCTSRVSYTVIFITYLLINCFMSRTNGHRWGLTILQYFPVMLMTMTTTTAAETTTTTVGWRADLIKWKTLEEILFKRISHQFVCHSVSIDTLNQISQQLVSMLDSSNHLLQNTFPATMWLKILLWDFLGKAPMCFTSAIPLL